jgi:S-adenosylhomocysteine hydrolase
MENDYKVRDITLAEFGRREIEIAEVEMPGMINFLINRTNVMQKGIWRC